MRSRVLGFAAVGAAAVAAIVVVAVVFGAGKAGSDLSAKKAAGTGAHALPAAVTSVTVLNGTEQEGLAHDIAAQLQEKGYARATALDGKPPGAIATTVVEYAPGDRADAEGVARAMGITAVSPMASAVSPLGAGAQVVVVVGANTAATVP